MHKKEPRDISEHVKSQHFLGAYPETPSHHPYCWAPLFVFVLGPANPLGSPDYNNHTVTEFQNNASCSLSASVQTCPSFNHMGGNIWLGRKGTGKSINKHGFRFWIYWPQNTSVVNFYAPNGLRDESSSISILMRVIYDGGKRQQSMLDECFHAVLSIAT